jgi:hypothetical protein
VPKHYSQRHKVSVTVFLSPWLLCHVSAISGVSSCFPPKVQKHVMSHMTTTQCVRHVIHVTITHQVMGHASSLQYMLQYCCISFSAPSSLASLAEQASLEQHVCSSYCLTAYCHVHLSHCSNSCSYSQQLLHFPSDIYCS